MDFDLTPEQDELRTAYPMFFEASSDRVKRAVVSVEGMNRLMRLIAEHPGNTRKQIAKRVGYSTSWVSTCVLHINRSHPEALISQVRISRNATYSLTAAGSALLNNGGFQGEA